MVDSLSIRQFVQEVLAHTTRPLAQIPGTGKMPIPQKVFSLVERASCPSKKLIKKTFAKGLLGYTFS